MKIGFRKFIYLGLLLLFAFPIIGRADTSIKFNIDPAFNSSSNSTQYQISATLKKSFDKLNFYVEDEFLNSKTWTESNEMNNIFLSIETDFENNIYPILTKTFGKDDYPTKSGGKISVVFYPMKESARGYMRSIDAYDKTVNPMSNQGEIIYLNSSYIDSPYLSAILAHEFTHIIEYSQKTLKKNVIEDTWLSEARAEYAVTLLGYNTIENSYLDQRIKSFLNKPSDSLVDWNNASSDYGVVSLFVHYLVEQYGINILTDSLSSNKIGVNSINEALAINNYDERFVDAYRNWAIAVYLNDCSVSSKYCYKNDKLKNVKVLPISTFLPFFQESSISMNQLINNWSTNWQKFVGGMGDFKLDIVSPKDTNFRVAYIVKDLSDKSHVYLLNFKEGEQKQIVIPNLRENVSSIVFIFSAAGTISGNDLANSFFVYNTTASTMIGENNPNQEIQLPFEVNKPLSQMNKGELLNILLRVVIYLLSQGKIITY